MTTRSVLPATPDPAPVRENAPFPAAASSWHAISGWRTLPLAGRVLACWILFFVSSQIIFTGLGTPRAIIFDETYFIPTAQKYLNRVFFLEPHPPLGKLLIAAGQAWLYPEVASDQFVGVERIRQSWPAALEIVGYRLMPAAFGSLIGVIAFSILVNLLRHTLAAFAFALLFVFDTAIIVQSRAALLDSFLLCFVLLSILLFLRLWRLPRVPWQALALSAAWGVVLGSATAVKITGLFTVVLVIPLFVRWVRAGQWYVSAAVVSTVAVSLVATYLLHWAIHFAVADRLITHYKYEISPVHRQLLLKETNLNPLATFIVQMGDAIRYQAHYQQGVPSLDLDRPDEIGSPWYWWMLGGRAINYRWETADGISYRYIYLLGNPVTWLASLLGVLWGTGLAVFYAGRPAKLSGLQWLLISLVACFWAYMIPMMLIRRVMYLYHYLPPMSIGVLIFALCLRNSSRLSAMTRRDMAVVLALLALAAFIALRPLALYEPLDSQAFQQLNVWPMWQLKCVGC